MIQDICYTEIQTILWYIKSQNTNKSNYIFALLFLDISWFWGLRKIPEFNTLCAKLLGTVTLPSWFSGNRQDCWRNFVVPQSNVYFRFDCISSSCESGSSFVQIYFLFLIISVLEFINLISFQLLKSLFETNCGQSSPKEIDKDHHRKVCGFYSNVFFLPLQNLANHLDINAKSPFDFNKV
jgi:hypothetical protein